MRLTTACLVLMACQQELASAPHPQPLGPPAAALALAKTFTPEIVGALAPTTPIAGDYAMALAMTFDSFPTTEMHIDERRTGAVHLTLGGDGTASACLGSRGSQGTMGQWHYEPPERRQGYRGTEDQRLVALAGTWTVVDGVATIRFDRVGWSTCDPAKAEAIGRSFTELRCIGILATDRIPTAGLACEASESSELLGLGMPMAAKGTVSNARFSAPSGRDVILGSRGIRLTVNQDSHAMTPTFEFRDDPAALVEAEFLRTKK